MTAAPKPEKRQHTPGPWLWQWAVNDNREADGRIYTDPKNCVVGLGMARCVAVSPRYESEQQWAANARLIAAAPEMLALIKETRCPGGGWNGMPDRLEGVAEVKDCLAAGMCGCVYGDVVKKAEGR